jgi:GIY-YIG catalytic domain
MAARLTNNTVAEARAKRASKDDRPRRLNRLAGVHMGAYVYMLPCSDGSLYVGSATGDDLLPRIETHNAGAFPAATHGHGAR